MGCFHSDQIQEGYVIGPSIIMVRRIPITSMFLSDSDNSCIDTHDAVHTPYIREDSPSVVT